MVTSGQCRRLGDVGARCFLLQRLRETEVEDLHGAVGSDFDIRGFQIAMDDASLVGGGDASVICIAIGSASSSAIGTSRMRSASVGPSTSSMTSAHVSPDFSSP